MPNFNPFGNDNENTSFERGAPINQAAKNVVQGATSQVKTAAKSVGDDITSQILGALYGPSQDQGTDEANASQTDQSNPLAHAAKQMGANNSSASTTNSNQSPQELADLEKVRRELSGNYSAQFNTAHNGPFNITTNLEQEIERARKEREQKEMQRKQQEEEEEQRRKQEEEAKKQQIAMPSGKKTGMMGNQPQKPMAVRLEETKTEGNRGTSG